MDEIVLQAMAKWPNVPAVYGWLSLDRRGNWLLKGESITNEALIAFIGRNYLSDESGRWFFQNGPQRVYVALARAPFVFRVSSREHEPLALDTHNGLRVQRVDKAWMDEQGAFILVTEHGPGTVYDLDLDRLTPYFTDEHGAAMDDDTLDAIFEHATGAPPLWLSFAGSRIRVEHIRSTEIAARCGFVPDPSQNTTPDRS